MIESVSAVSPASTTPSAASRSQSGSFAATLAGLDQGTASGDASSGTVASPTISGSPLASSLLLASGQLFASDQEEQSFAADLTGRLRAAGIDTTQPIQLSVDSQGHVKAKEGTPGKEAIDAVFASDPGLENTYRKIANTEETKAMVSKYEAYSAAYSAAGSPDAQAAAYRQYEGLFQAIQSVGSTLTLADGELHSAAAGLAKAEG